MRGAGWPALLASAAIFLGACSTPPAGQSASSGRTSNPCRDSQTAPKFAASSTTNQSNVELVWLKGSQKYVVRDITNILSPTTISGFDGLVQAEFVNASEISYVSGNSLIRMHISGNPKRSVATACNAVVAFAWSSDGASAAYVANERDNSASQLHLVAAGVDRVVDTMPPLPWEFGCENATCAASLDLRLVFSQSGNYISLVDNWGGPTLRIWTSDGKPLKSIDSPSHADLKTTPTMSVWSGNSLYFRDDKGVEVWRGNGDESLLMPGVAWIRPKASPDGTQIVYAARDASGTAHVYVFGTRTASMQELGKSRSEPAFLNSHLIWYREERLCLPADACSGITTVNTGKTFVYDLQDNTETESVIAAVWDAWPHGN